MGGSQIRPGGFEKKNLFPLPVTDRRLINCLAFNLVTSLNNVILTSESDKDSSSSNF